MQINSLLDSGAVSFGRATQQMGRVANDLAQSVQGFEHQDPGTPQSYYNPGHVDLDEGIISMQNTAAVAKTSLAVMRAGKEQFNDLISILSSHSGK